MRLRKNQKWVVVDNEGWFWWQASGITRNEAIRSFCDMNGIEDKDERRALWKKSKAEGFRCVVAQVSEVSK